jgi:hypothetical protein
MTGTYVLVLHPNCVITKIFASKLHISGVDRPGQYVHKIHALVSGRVNLSYIQSFRVFRVTLIIASRPVYSITVHAKREMK